MKRFLLFFITLALYIASNSSFAQVNPPERCRCGRTGRRAVCPKDVPRSVLYRPSFVACGNKAAIILRGDFLESFSVVLRDSLNRDRWPAAGSGYGGCSQALADSAAPPRSCSAFKASSEYTDIVGGRMSRVICFPESGDSPLYSDVRRMTIKVTNSAADLRRFCLNGPTNRLN
jgi:hypothetical protein